MGPSLRASKTPRRTNVLVVGRFGGEDCCVREWFGRQTQPTHGTDCRAIREQADPHLCSVACGITSPCTWQTMYATTPPAETPGRIDSGILYHYLFLSSGKIKLLLPASFRLRLPLPPSFPPQVPPRGETGNKRPSSPFFPKGDRENGLKTGNDPGNQACQPHRGDGPESVTKHAGCGVCSGCTSCAVSFPWRSSP